MANPFPGIDPYVEAQGGWTDFHPNLITYIREAIALRLPDNYVARVGERLDLMGWSAGQPRAAYPDVMVAQRGPRSSEVRATATALAEWEPTVFQHIEIEEEVDVRYTWVEILHLPEQRLVTSIEVLSPANKQGAGRAEYLTKFNRLWRAEVNLVEIDLLIGGRPLKLDGPYPPGDFRVTIARADQRPNCEVSAWSVRLAPPTIPIPLVPPDPDIALALAPLVARCHELARYDRTLDYSKALGLPLSAEDLEWAERIARGRQG